MMSTVLDINRLTRTEKLRAMEELWEDLSRTETEYESPEWHGEVLRAREEDIRAGRDEFVPWEEAKRILRERTKRGSFSSVQQSGIFFEDASSTKNRTKGLETTSRHP